ncbi:MAG TPA: hypothetical protein VEQ36_08770 [Thermomicrobiales bacterium]|nr:hypothetical protein [Thermomicrobiales bacterium]
MLPIPENNRTDIYGDPIDDLLDDDDVDLGLAAEEPMEEVTVMPKWARIVIILTVVAMIGSTVWWIWFL